MKILILSILTIIFGNFTYAADSGLDPNSLSLKLHRFFVSKSPLCTNPQLIVDRSSNPQYVDIMGLSANFGSGVIENGTYPCVMLEVSDTIKFYPAENSDSGNCVVGTEASLDICMSGTSTSINGNTINCTTSEEKLVLYLSTVGAADGDGFDPPETESNARGKGLRLSSPLVVNGDVTSRIVVNGAGKVSDRGGVCGMSPPAFSFAQN